MRTASQTLALRFYVDVTHVFGPGCWQATRSQNGGRARTTMDTLLLVSFFPTLRHTPACTVSLRTTPERALSCMTLSVEYSLLPMMALQVGGLADENLLHDMYDM